MKVTYSKIREGFIALAASLAVTLAIGGCPKIEKDAYLVAVGAKAFLDSEYSKHPECATNPATNVCVLLRKATSAKDVLIDAAEVYCGGPGYMTGGPCAPPAKTDTAYKVAYDRLSAALADYQQTEKDLKALLQKGGN